MYATFKHWTLHDWTSWSQWHFKLFGIDTGCKTKETTSDDERNLRFIIVSFGVGFTICVVFGQRLFTSVVSLMTAVKGCSLLNFCLYFNSADQSSLGTLLVLMVAVTAYVAFDILQEISSDWSHIAEAFLMSTVALGGAINLMPLIFNKVYLESCTRLFAWACSHAPHAGSAASERSA